MKTNLVAAALMTMIAAVAPARVSDVARPSPVDVGGTVRFTPRTGALQVVRVDALPVQWVSPVEARIGAAVAVAPFAVDPYFAEVFLDGDLVAQGYVRPGTSMLIRGDVKSDGKAHEMRVRAYRDMVDGPRVLAKDQAFRIWLPAQ